MVRSNWLLGLLGALFICSATQAYAQAEARSLDIWLVASGNEATSRSDFNAIGPFVYFDGQKPGLSIYDAKFPDILFRFTSITSIRDALWYIKSQTGPWGTLSKQTSPPNIEFGGGPFAEITIPPAPTSFVDIDTTDVPQTIIDGEAAGTDFRFLTGTHRNRSFIPRNNDTFTGATGAILNGSELLTSWNVDGARWRHDSLSTPLSPNGLCKEGRICTPREDIYFNDVPLIRVATEEEVVTGKFAEVSNSVWIATDPAGQTVERAITAQAITGSATGVVLRNFTVEKYASLAQSGAITHGTGGWSFFNMTVQLNHGMGLTGTSGDILVNSDISTNGQMGLGSWAGATGGLILNNTFTGNNYGGFLPGWEAGALKVVRNTGVKFRYNCVSDNEGRGLWFDIDNVNAEIDNNMAWDNEQGGIIYEISYQGQIRGNIASGNGNTFVLFLFGSGIVNQGSPDTDILDNIIQIRDIPNNGNGIGLIQQNRGSGVLGDYLNVRDDVLRNNIIYLAAGVGSSGYVADFNPSAMTGGGGNWDFNTYTKPEADNATFSYPGLTLRTFAQWQALGIEVNSTYVNNQETEVVIECNG